MTQAPATTTVLPLSEAFGPTWQGEGPYAGQRCWFVRLGLCNLSCEWCDTPYTWDNSRFDVAAECPDTPVDRINWELERLGARGGPGQGLVILSGGEPLMHHTKLRDLLAYPYRWQVETNGTIPPPEWWLGYVEHTIVSPKVITHSDPQSKRLKPRALSRWADLARHRAATFKFVAATVEDVEDIAHAVGFYGIPHESAWIMPEGRTAGEVLHNSQQIADTVLREGFHFTTRLHVLLYGDERGH